MDSGRSAFENMPPRVRLTEATVRTVGLDHFADEIFFCGSVFVIGFPLSVKLQIAD